MSLVQVLTLPTTCQLWGAQRPGSVPKVGSSQVQMGPQGVQRGLCLPHQDTPGQDLGQRGHGRSWRLSPPFPLSELAGCSEATGTTGQPPDLGEGPTHRLWENGEEKKGGSSGFFVAKNWPQTLSTGTLEQIFLGHTHLPATTCHTTKLTAHTFPLSSSALPALAQPTLGTLTLTNFLPRIYLNPPARVEICPSMSRSKALLLLAQGPGSITTHSQPSGPRGRHGQSWASKQGARTSTLKPPKPRLNAFEVGLNLGTLDGSQQREQPGLREAAGAGGSLRRG